MKADSNNEKNLGRKSHWNVLLNTFTLLVKRVFATYSAKFKSGSF